MAVAKTIVFLYAFDFSGHHRACLAVERAVRAASPQTRTCVLNVLDLLGRRVGGAVESLYLSIARNAPDAWDYVYDHPAVFRMFRSFRAVALGRLNGRFSSWMDRIGPDAVVCTQALPAMLASDYKAAGARTLPVVAVLTDHHPHAYWHEPGITRFIVPSGYSSGVLVSRGVPVSKILEIGIPVDPAFAPAHFQPGAQPQVLLMGGGSGILPFEKLAGCLDLLKPDFRITAITGRNRRALEALSRMAPCMGKPLAVFPYVTNVHEHLARSRVLITKGGGLSTAEALACGVPAVILPALKGQERFNAERLAGEPGVWLAGSCEEAAKIAGEILEGAGGARLADRKLLRLAAASETARRVLELT